MDVKKYLSRIGLTNVDNRKPDFEFLTEIQTNHVLNVPWENFDVIIGKHVTLTPEALYDKIVTKHRGGWCFELNGLLHWALLELGFNAKLVGSRVWNVQLNEWQIAQNHMVIIVTLGSMDYVTDVAYFVSKTPMKPIPMAADGKSWVDGPNGRFRVIKMEDYWRLDKQHLDDAEDDWQIVTRIDASIKYQLLDFQDICNILATGQYPLGIYISVSPIIFMKTKRGEDVVAMLENSLFHYSNVGKRSEKVKEQCKGDLNEEEYENILTSVFNLNGIDAKKLNLARFKQVPEDKVDKFVK